MTNTNQSPNEAGDLRDAWIRRSASSDYRFYIASIPGFRSEHAWQKQARIDADLALYGIDRAWLKGAHFLDVGCGIGRVTSIIARETKSATGIDICEPFIEEARRLPTSGLDMRFFSNDGLTVPPEAADRPYSLILAFAVFIHCPQNVIRSLLRSALKTSAPGSIFRFQLLGDLSDSEGVQATKDTDAVHAQAQEQLDNVPDASLIHDIPYVGDRFAWRDVPEFVRSCGWELNHRWRFDLANIYCEATPRSAARGAERPTADSPGTS